MWNKTVYLKWFSIIEREIILLYARSKKYPFAEINYQKYVLLKHLANYPKKKFRQCSITCWKKVCWISTGVTFVITLVRRLWFWGDMVWHLWLLWCDVCEQVWHLWPLRCDVCDQVWQCDICDHNTGGEGGGLTTK